MKQLLSLLLLVSLFTYGLSAQRYIQALFSDEEIVVQQDVVFGINMSVLEQYLDPDIDVPVADTLRADVYMPDLAIDDVAERPIIFINAAQTIPIYIVDCYGDRRDEMHQHIARTMAQRGYVVFVFNARTGFNLSAATQVDYVQTWVDFYIRQGIDYRTAARFIRKDIAENGNSYGVHPEQFILWGALKGGSEIQAAYYNSETDYEAPGYYVQDLNGELVHVVELEKHGGLFGTHEGFDAEGNLSNIPNHSEYTQEQQFDLVITSRGILFDSLALQADEAPLISVLNGNEVAAQFESVFTSVPLVEFSIEVFFAQLWQKQAIELGNLDVWNDLSFANPIANTRFAYTPNPSYGPAEGLVVLNGPAANQAPWIFWEESICDQVDPDMHDNSLTFQEGMTPELGMATLDTIIQYWTPRACVLFGWEACEDAVISKANALSIDPQRALISPNPASGPVRIESTNGALMEQIQVFNLAGQVVYETKAAATLISVDAQHLPAGVYWVAIQFADGVLTKRMIIQ